jgi:hypothetical protein
MDKNLVVEPATGWSWTVWYEWEDNEPEAMLVFAITPERALEEAHYSLTYPGIDYSILGMVRDDVSLPRI